MKVLRLLALLALWLLLLVPRPGGAAELVSATAAGAAPSGASSAPSISGDGRYVAFVSSAQFNSEDSNGRKQLDVYVRDRLAKTVRLVSDDRGGDQPMISANGRFVSFRAFDEFPKIRRVDLFLGTPPETVSFPYGSGSFRHGDLGSITPDGVFVAFDYRPDPVSNLSDTQLSVVDATLPAGSRTGGGFSITKNLNLHTLGRFAMTRDAQVFFFETRDALPGATLDNGNQTQDIYRMDRNGNYLRISSTEGNPDESALGARNSAHDPALSADGQTLYFISERKLTNADTDGHATIYRTTFALGNSPLTVPISVAPITPLSLSPQATGDGQYLVFTGRTRLGNVGFFIVRLSDGKVLPVGSGSGAPSLSADNGFIAFASPSSLFAKDKNGLSDVYVIPNPFGNVRLAAPQVTLTWNNPAAGSTIVSGTSVNLTASSTVTNGGIQYIQVEVDGLKVNRVNNASTIPAQNYALARGVHTLRATALDAANVPGESAEFSITVSAPANNLLFEGITGLVREGEETGGPVTFSGVARLQNTSAAARGPVQLVLTEAPTQVTWETFGKNDTPLVRDEQVLAVYNLSSIAGQTVVEQPFRGVTRAPEVAGDFDFSGVGYTIIARLRELSGASYVTRESLNVFTVLPRLNDDTPGPNGGIPVTGDMTADSNFDPALLDHLEIIGPSTLAGGTSRVYVARAIYSPNTPKTCTPAWSVQGSVVAASVSTSGGLTVGQVTAARQLNLKAEFGGKSVVLSITIRPSTPKVSVRASPALVAETVGAGVAKFRILRSPAGKQPLTVNYVVSGVALPNTDYSALSGTVDIPAGKGSVDIPVTPLDDANPEGRESIVVSLLTSNDYRLGTPSEARMQIEDDEPAQTGQPDATIRRGSHAAVGTKVYSSLVEEQEIAVNTGRDIAQKFTLTFTNPTSAAEDLTLSGPGDFNGFVARYSDATGDVTAAMTGLGLKYFAVPPGASMRVNLKITATSATPLQALFECPVVVQSGNGLMDTVQATVRRVR